MNTQTKTRTMLLLAIMVVAQLITAASCGGGGKSFKIVNLKVPSNAGISHTQTVYLSDTQGQTSKGKEQDWDVKFDVTVPSITCNASRKSLYGIGIFLNLAPNNKSGIPLMQAVLSNSGCSEWDLGFQFYPKLSQVFSNVTISPGDQVTLELSYSAATHQYQVTDTYPGGTLNAPTALTVTSPAQNHPTQVQWGMEAPLLKSGFALLPKFDSVQISNITINGTSLGDYGGKITHYGTPLVKDTTDFSNSQVGFKWIKEK